MHWLLQRAKSAAWFRALPRQFYKQREDTRHTCMPNCELGECQLLNKRWSPVRSIETQDQLEYHHGQAAQGLTPYLSASGPRRAAVSTFPVCGAGTDPTHCGLVGVWLTSHGYAVPRRGSPCPLASGSYSVGEIAELGRSEPGEQ